MARIKYQEAIGLEVKRGRPGRGARDTDGPARAILPIIRKGGVKRHYTSQQNVTDWY